MFCNKKNVNLLTALLQAHSIHHIVICPGSRNAVLAHNFNEGRFTLHPVTDERSAGFVALGLIAATSQPVAVCVTSGSAVLGLHPSVAEAQERHLPLLVISADRPACWIGQLDGQTLPQPSAFAHLHIPHVQLPEIHDEQDAWWCRRLVREALTGMSKHEGGPAHINIPISEPLFQFTTEDLPQVRKASHYAPASYRLPEEVVRKIEHARLPVVYIGQLTPAVSQALSHTDLLHHDGLLFLPDPLANVGNRFRAARLEMSAPLRQEFAPDLILHLGGNVVHKQLKLRLRSLPHATAIRFGFDSHLVDTFQHDADWVEMPTLQALKQLCSLRLNRKPEVVEWSRRLDQASNPADLPLPFSDLYAMRHVLQRLPQETIVEVGNSRPVRSAAVWAPHHGLALHCNRGVNGIEGSLSTAVGHALGCSKEMVVCLIGDLSFFYDLNALWNVDLPRNLRIVLFNNGHGQIFDALPGLSASPALTRYISATHHTSARGLAQSFELTYLTAHDEASLQTACSTLLQSQERASLLEIFTPAGGNQQSWIQLKQWFEQLG